MLDISSWTFPRMVEDFDYRHTSHSYGVGSPGGVHVERFELAREGSFGVHVERGLHQLTWLDGATLGVFAAGEFVVVPPEQAIWIPADTAHDVASYGAGTMYCLYFREDDETLPLDATALIEADDLVRGLVRHLSSGVGQEPGLRARGVLLDALRARLGVAHSRRAAGGGSGQTGVTRSGSRSPSGTADLPISLPMPAEPRARAIAELVLDDLSSHEPLTELAARTGAHARTIRRRFLEETGLSFRDWVTHARLSSSLPWIAGELPIAEVAALVGYASQASFTAAFRARFGETPGAHRARLRARGVREARAAAHDS